MSACPGPNELQALVGGFLPTATRDLVLEHLGQCASCASELDALVSDPSADGDGDADRAAGPALGPLVSRRFEIRRCLGVGGFGLVFEAFDHQRGALVALKWLRDVTPTVLARFKREFRALWEVSHPNVLVPRELLAVEDKWLLTTDLVDGVSFLDWVRSAPADHDDDGRAHAATRTEPPPPPRHGADLERLRDALGQLASGLGALHRAGILHRDLKPQNVLVTATGRVVLIDFGLVAELGERGLADSALEQLVGTPAYAAPEQCAGAPIDEAADWYAVGVMLFQALCGRLPFTGATAAVLDDKQRLDAPPIGTLVSGVPAAIARLADELLARDPARRPGGPEVLRRLATEDERGGDAASPGIASATGDVFIGRRREQEALGEAFAVADRGGLALALVGGEPGIGKSALCRRFLAELEAKRKDVLVLRARCNEREAIPYRALDGWVDGLAGLLRRMPEAERLATLPRDLDVLARIFPVLQPFGERHRSFRAERHGSDLEMRLWAFDALHDLVARLSAQRPVVLFIDDLQWGDADSRPFFEGLLRPPAPPGLLVIASYRASDAAGAPLVEVLLGARTSRRSPAEVRVVDLAPLDEPDARELARALLPDGAETAAATIARHAAGSPLFLTQLALSFAGDAASDLRSALRHRLDDLPSGGRALVEAVAAAGRPAPVALALYASDVGPDGDALLVRLCAARLLRLAGADRVEVYHDRIREVVLADLPGPLLAARHARWLDTLVAAGHDEPGVLLMHALGAGLSERAAEYALRGAEQAVTALAFDRAADLFRIALEQGELDPSTRRSVLRQRADALASAGQVRAAADAYLVALADAAGPEALDLRRRAAEQLLRGGHLAEGLEVARDLLSAVGLRLSRTQRRALASMLWHRAALGLRGLRFTERAAHEVDPELLARIDACWAVALGLCNTELVHGMDFLGKHLRLALSAGEPGRVARGLGVEAMFSAARGAGPAIARARGLAEAATALAERCNDRHARVFAALGTGVAAFSEYRWRECRPHFARVKELDAVGGAHATWERGTADWFIQASLLFSGEVGEMMRSAAPLVSQAHERGDRYTATLLRAWIVPMGHLWCGADPVAAREELADAMAAWTRDAFHMMHLLALYTETSIHLFEGDAAGAHRVITRGWPRLVASHLFQVRALEIHSRELRARTLLALSRREPGRQKALLAAVEADARWLRRQERALPHAYAAVLEAGLVEVRGRDPEPSLVRAERLFVEAGMDLWAASVQRRRGEVGEPSTIAAADEALVRLGVREPARAVAMMFGRGTERS